MVCLVSKGINRECWVFPSDPSGGRHNVLIGPSHTHMGPAGVSPYRGSERCMLQIVGPKDREGRYEKNLSVFK